MRKPVQRRHRKSQNTPPSATADTTAPTKENRFNPQANVARIAQGLGRRVGQFKPASDGVFAATWNWLAQQTKRAVDAGKQSLADRGIEQPRDVGRALVASQNTLADVAMTLRIGLGALFVIGGWNKLSKLLSPESSAGLVESYTATTGYINEFFMVWLFSGPSPLTPWGFLTALSAFELVTGIMLLVGLLVRPVALIYAFLLWTFVISLPVVTTNGVDPGVATYMAPALLVQIRDVALSGIMFVLFGLGSGARSVDIRIFGEDAAEPVMSWETAALLLRLSTASVLIVGGLFAGMPNIKSFMEPGLIMAAVGAALLWGGAVTRYAAMAACAIIGYYMLTKIGIDKGLVGSLNAIKRELALFAAAFVLAVREASLLWTASDVWTRLRDGVDAARTHRGLAPNGGKVVPAE